MRWLTERLQLRARKPSDAAAIGTQSATECLLLCR
jgi:hypothetical protein